MNKFLPRKNFVYVHAQKKIPIFQDKGQPVYLSPKNCVTFARKDRPSK